MAQEISGETPIIPRTSLFGPPVRRAGSISPGGRWLAWIAPVDGVPNIWVAPFDDPDAHRILTHDTGRGIRSYRWSFDDRFVLYHQDEGGNELFHVHAVPIEGGAPRDLTPFDGARCGIEQLSPLRRNEVLVSSNARNPNYPDLLAIDIWTGEATLIEENDRFESFVSDDRYRPRIARESHQDGGASLFTVRDGAWSHFLSISPDDANTTFVMSLDAAQDTLYLCDSAGRDTAALFAVSLADGHRRLIAEDARADIGDTIDDPVTHRPLAYGVNYERHERHALDDSIAATIAFLDVQDIGDWSLSSRSEDDRWWTVDGASDVRPGVAYLLDRSQMTLRKLYATRPELEDATLSHTYPTIIAARDGLAMVSYLTLPPGLDRGGIEAGVAAPGPLVLLVHGGPWFRDSYGYDAEAQWLANRGYAVLAVNFRASTGFGKKHLLAGFGEWGGRMDEDLDDAVAWVVERGFADPDRIGIMGASYGGFAVLSGLTTRPLQYACGVDIVGPANLETLMAAIPPWWESQRAFLYRAVGDPGTEAGRDLLKSRSPLHHARQLVRPLLIGQGANDPRVRQEEADQIADALRANGGTPNYLLFGDEGHGFVRPPNALAFNAVAEAFLATHLGGRAEPFDRDEVAGTTMHVVDGEDWLRSLVQNVEKLPVTA